MKWNRHNNRIYICLSCAAVEIIELRISLQVKADKIVENAKQEAAKVKAQVYEQTERTIADSTARAEKVQYDSPRDVILSWIKCSSMSFRSFLNYTSAVLPPSST